MRSKLTWLHISDIHFHPSVEWRDNTTRRGLFDYLKKEFESDDSLRPDLIFCTGDIAYGDTGSAPLSDQYRQARAFFDDLRAVCGRIGAPVPKERLFVVPGNHDVNRTSINSDAQTTLTNWAKVSNEHVNIINQRFNDRTREFTEAVKRLDEYATFLREYLPHQQDPDGRHRYANIVDIDGLKVAVVGFNSAWSCAGPEDDRNIWLAAQWQFNAANQVIQKTDVRIGLIHHPVDWLNEADRNITTPRISTDYHFWLHGHSHKAWVTPDQTHVIIAAGAVGAETSDEFGINLVRIDLSQREGTVFLHQHKAGGKSWTVAPIEVHAPRGQWPFELPIGLHAAIPSIPPAPKTLAKRTIKLYGRNDLLKEASAKLHRAPFLLVYGLRGIGKSALIEELAKDAPLAGKESVRITINPSTTADELFRQVATLLGETAEFPKSPQGDVHAIAAEITRRYPKPRSAWIWIDRAHHLLDASGFRHPELHHLLLGLQTALTVHWQWVLELRERPPRGLLGTVATGCEVPGLDRNSLGDCIADAAPEGQEARWRYRGDQLKSIYQWLGGGWGAHAHPYATQLLIEVARGRNETPQEVLDRHRGDFAQKVEDVLLGDLYANVLSTSEQRLLLALALYRAAIPHDHADALEQRLGVQGAWDGLDRRCLLLSSPDHHQFYLHSFIAAWLRTRHLGYLGHGEDDEADFADVTK